MFNALHSSYRTHLKQLKEQGICPFCESEENTLIDHNASAFVMLARAPYQEGHILVCPQRHGELLTEFSEHELSDLYQLILKRERILYTQYGELVVFLRQGSTSGITGKSIHHLHRHIVPNFTIQYGGSQEKSDERQIYSIQQMKEKSQQMRQRL